MTVSFEYLATELKKRNIRLTHQRLKVLEYISNNRIHPTVDQIYSDLHKEIPSLSKTTIYNTLSTLVEAKFVKVITIEDNETKYDVITDDHGHFKCESCGNIYDFHINIDAIASEDLNNFHVNQKDVYFKGICPSCKE